MTHQPRGWHTEDIKAALRKRFGPISHLSRNWGYNPKAISNTLRNPTESITVEKRIALVLGVRPQELWPDRWDAKTGEPLPRASRAVSTAKASPASRQKRTAA